MRTLATARAEELDHAPEFANICAGPGCSRPPREPGKSLCSAHDKQAQRRGRDGLQPIKTPEEPIPPCRACGGRDFDLKCRKGKLARVCAPCRKRSNADYIARNIDAHRARVRRWNSANRDRMREANRRWRERERERRAG